MYRRYILTLSLTSSQADKASNEEKQDNMLYDEEQQRYLQLLANGGVEELAVDASDIDSSDVSSDGGSEDEHDDVDGDVPSDSRGGGFEKHARSEVDVSGSREDDTSQGRNPLLAEISTKSERRQAATQRWFNDPLFEGVEEEHDEEVAHIEDSTANGGESQNGRAAKRPRSESDTRGRKSLPGVDGERLEVEEGRAAAAVLESMPMTDKEKRKEKRKKVMDHAEEPRVMSLE